MKNQELVKKLQDNSKNCLILTTGKTKQRTIAVKGTAIELGELLYSLFKEEQAEALFSVLLATVASYVSKNPEYLPILKLVTKKVEKQVKKNPFK